MTYVDFRGECDFWYRHTGGEGEAMYVKEQPIRFLDKLDRGCKRKRKIKGCLPQKLEKMQLHFTKTGKIRRAAGLGGKHGKFSLEYAKFEISIKHVSGVLSIIYKYTNLEFRENIIIRLLSTYNL